MRPRGSTTLVASLVLLAGCGGGAEEADPTQPAASATERLSDEALWVGTTKSGLSITAEAPADDDHPLVAKAEEYREATYAPEVTYVVVVYDNTEGTATADVFSGARVVTDEGDEVHVPHLAAADGVFEAHVKDQLPLELEEEALQWYADFHRHQAVAPGAAEEVVLGTVADVPSVAELHVTLDEDGGEVALEPAP